MKWSPACTAVATASAPRATATPTATDSMMALRFGTTVDCHGRVGVVALGHVDGIVGERGAGEQRASRPEVDDVVLGAELVGAAGGVLDLLGVALAVVERQRDELHALGGEEVGERDRVESAREGGDDAVHEDLLRVAVASITMPPRGCCVRVTVTSCGSAARTTSSAISAASASQNAGRSRKDHR